MIILSHDPGTVSYGWCVNSYSPAHFEVLELGMMNHRVSAVHEGLGQAIQAYLEEVDGIVRRHNVTHMCFERFQARSTGLYNTIECINLMMGALLGAYAASSAPLVFDAFYASNWKNSVNAKLRQEFGFNLDLPPAGHKTVTKAARAKLSKEQYRTILDERAIINNARKDMPCGYRNLFPLVPDHMVDAFFINVCSWYRSQGTKPFDGIDAYWFETAGIAVCKRF